MEKQAFVVLHTIQEDADIEINFEVCESYETAKRCFDEHVSDEKLNGAFADVFDKNGVFKEGTAEDFGVECIDNKTYFYVADSDLRVEINLITKNVKE